jgi:3-hydroxyisobutyrate dehydrogenase-like beta-hydroxyacid dehydrogenase
VDVAAELVAVIGVGRIGLPVVARLAQAGYRVRACDVRPEVEPEVRAAGADWFRSASDAIAGAGVLVTVLPGSPELRDAMLGADGLLEQLRGIDWLDMTSAAPDLAAELTADADRVGVAYLDCAVGGGVSAAQRGELTFYVGGPRDLFDRRRPLLSVLAAEHGVHFLGEHGNGYLVKLLVNLLWFGQAVATAEVLLLGQVAGLEPDRLAAVLAAGPAASEFIRAYLPAVLEGDYLPSFGLDRCVEELDSLVRFADVSGTPFELSSAVAAIHRAALDRFGPVAGELLGVAHLESLAGRALSRRPPTQCQGSVVQSQ